MTLCVGSSRFQMDVINFSRIKGAQSGSQTQKYHFWVSFVNHTGSVEKH